MPWYILLFKILITIICAISIVAKIGFAVVRGDADDTAMVYPAVSIVCHIFIISAAWVM